MRHNELRDLECSMLRTVCRDVRSEPKLIPVTGEQFNRSTIIDDEARPDISARDVWGRMDKAFFDVRITHPNAESMRNMPLSKIYEKHENEKKRSYNSRIINIEKASFCPLVFTTHGGQAPECQRFHKRLAELTAIKKNVQATLKQYVTSGND